MEGEVFWAITRNAGLGEGLETGPQGLECSSDHQQVHKDKGRNSVHERRILQLVKIRTKSRETRVSDAESE